MVKGILGAVLLAAGIGVLCLPSSNDCWSGHAAKSRLRGIVPAQEEFRSTDADRNGKNDYWRKDIAGLYAVRAAGQPIRFIELSVALADGRPTEDMTPYGDRFASLGYRFRALRFRDETEPDPDRFAACAYLEKPWGQGYDHTFLISHRKQGWAKEIPDPEALEFFPVDPRAEGWITFEEFSENRRRDRRWSWLRNLFR